MVSDKSGKFLFPSLSPGEYKLVPYYAGAQTKFDVQPPELSFKVNHNSVVLRQGFKVTGFTVNGIVRTAIAGDPLPGAKILLSQKEVATTDSNGKYVLDNMKAGQYILKAESGMYIPFAICFSVNTPRYKCLFPCICNTADVLFDEKSVKIDQQPQYL